MCSFNCTSKFQTYVARSIGSVVDGTLHFRPVQPHAINAMTRRIRRL